MSEELRHQMLELVQKHGGNPNYLPHYKIIEAMLEAYRLGQSQAIPPGWKLVPVEPTPHMLKSGVHAFQHARQSDDNLDDWRANYRAMLAAAPTPQGENHE